MMLTVATIFDIVKIIASFLAEQAQSLCTGDMKLLPAACFVTLHASSHICSTTFALFLTDVTCLKSFNFYVTRHKIKPITLLNIECFSIWWHKSTQASFYPCWHSESDKDRMIFVSTCVIKWKASIVINLFHRHCNVSD